MDDVVHDRAGEHRGRAGAEHGKIASIRMPELDGLGAARRVIALGLDTRVMIRTTFDADAYVYEAPRTGASGFLRKGAYESGFVAPEPRQ